MSDWHPGIPLEYRNEIVTGDARLLAESIPDESIDLIFTDPVYWEVGQYHWLGKEAMRLLKPNRPLLVFCGIGLLPETLACLVAGGLNYRWLLPHVAPFAGGYCDTGQSKYMAMLWLEKGRTRPIKPLWDVLFVRQMNDHHIWRKDEATVMRCIESFSVVDATIYDPFAGGGTVPAVCKMLGRNYIASEIDPDTAERARLRVLMTQPPLFVPTEEQSMIWEAIDANA